MLLMPPATDKASLAIRRRMKEVGLTQSQFAQRVGRVQSWVSSRLFVDPDSTLRYLAYKEPEVLDRFLSALRWNIHQLNTATGLSLPVPATEEHADPSISSDTRVPLSRIVPVYAAGTGPAWDLDDALDQIFLPENSYPGQEVVGLRAMSDSMDPYLPRGAVAVVLLDDGNVQPGDFCGVWMSNDGVVIKRFVKELPDGQLLLESLNPEPGEDRYFTAPVGSRVMGRVVNRLLEG